MEKIYTGEELTREVKKKKRLMTFWYIALGIFLAAVAGFLVWFFLLDYDSPMILGIQIIVTAITALFLIATFLYFSIPFRRQRYYVKMLRHLETGLREFGEGKLLRFTDATEMRDGVDFKNMITEEWSERRQEFLERKVLIDAERPLPDIKEGERVQYTTQGNVLVEYRIVPESGEINE